MKISTLFDAYRASRDKMQLQMVLRGDGCDIYRADDWYAREFQRRSRQSVAIHAGILRRLGRVANSA